jgi:hypothetical protein
MRIQNPKNKTTTTTTTTTRRKKKLPLAKAY